MSDDIADLADQDWKLDADAKSGRFEYTRVDGHTMEFKCQDPDTDDLLDFFAPTGDDDQSRDEEMFELVSSAIVEPRVTLERWQQLKPADKIGLFEQVADQIGVNEVLGFTGSGADLDLDDL